VIIRAQGWRELASWASLHGISMIATTPTQSLRAGAGEKSYGTLAGETLHIPLRGGRPGAAVGLISEGHFDGHDVLFADSREALTSSYENAKLLIVGYNWFADENGKDLSMSKLSNVGRDAIRINSSMSGSCCLGAAPNSTRKIFEARDEFCHCSMQTSPSAD